MIALITLVIILSGVCYWRLIASYGYWKKKGIPYPKPVIFFGNLKSAMTFSKSLGQVYSDYYNEFKGLRYFGFFKIRQPAIVVRDPEIIKDILIKDFNSFQANDIETPDDGDLIAKNPFVLTGNMWKIVRTQLTPSFTSGKIKSIFSLLDSVGQNLVDYLENEVSATGKDGLEMKELASKFTTDAVATCAYGLEANSFTDPNAEFRTMGRKLTTPSFWLGIRHLILILMPGLAKFLKVGFIPEETGNWFRNIVDQTVNYRTKNNISRNDFIDLMIQLKSKPGEYEFTNEDITSHCASFFMDGFETSSGAITFTLYEIAVNPDVQVKLREEIDKVLEKHQGKITYDAIQDMPYLDKVFMENLRKNPPGLFLFKKCTQEYTLPPCKEDNTGTSLKVEVGTPMIIPLFGIHHDSKYYPNPDKFDPERFSEENKQARPKCSFLSFGEGPRVCLGQRFAIAQSKMALIAIVANYEIRLNPKTITPLQIDEKYFLLSAKGGIWMNFYKRNDKKVK